MILRGVLEVTALEDVAEPAIISEVIEPSVQVGDYCETVEALNEEPAAVNASEPEDALTEAEAAPNIEPEDVDAPENADAPEEGPQEAPRDDVGESEETAEIASPLTAIRKYIRDASKPSAPAASRKDYPIEWLTYYGRLNHRRSKAPSEQQLASGAYRNLVIDKS